MCTKGMHAFILYMLFSGSIETNKGLASEDQMFTRGYKLQSKEDLVLYLHSVLQRTHELFLRGEIRKQREVWRTHHVSHL